jgi:hypothetical protein
MSATNGNGKTEQLAGYCDQLDIVKGSTYAQAVPQMKERPEPFLS